MAKKENASGKCRKRNKTKFSLGVHADYRVSFETLTKELQRLFHLFIKSIWTRYKSFRTEYYSYVLLGTVLAVVVSSFLLPNISRKLHETKKLKDMKKVLNVMTDEVTRAEVACLPAADDVRGLHCSMHDSGTTSEVTLVSYFYTDSFDDKKE